MTDSTEFTVEPGSSQIRMTREFAAPRELVFRAHTDPDLFAQWVGPRRLTTTIRRFEVRDGGVWSYVATDRDGTEYGFHGVFHGDPTPERIVQTFEWEGAPGHVSLGIVELTEVDGRTRLTSTSVFSSVEDRDAMVESGMEYGVREGNERLDELLAGLRSSA